MIQNYDPQIWEIVLHTPSKNKLTTSKGAELIIPIVNFPENSQIPILILQFRPPSLYIVINDDYYKYNEDSLKISVRHTTHFFQTHHPCTNQHLCQMTSHL